MGLLVLVCVRRCDLTTPIILSTMTLLGDPIVLQWQAAKRSDGCACRPGLLCFVILAWSVDMYSLTYCSCISFSFFFVFLFSFFSFCLFSLNVHESQTRLLVADEERSCAMYHKPPAMTASSSRVFSVPMHDEKPLHCYDVRFCIFILRFIILPLYLFASLFARRP